MKSTLRFYGVVFKNYIKILIMSITLLISTLFCMLFKAALFPISILFNIGLGFYSGMDMRILEEEINK